MADEQIQYDDGGFGVSRKQQQAGGLIGFLIKAGFAKDQQQANTVLIGILVVAIVVGVGAWFIL